MLSKKIQGNLAALITVAIWGSAFVGIAIGLKDFSPGALALFRFFIASACLWTFLIFTKQHSLPQLRDIPILFFLGLSGVTIYHVLLNLGETHTHPATASFIISTTPLFTAIFAAVVRQEKKLSIYEWLGSLIALLGVGIISFTGNSHSTNFNLYAFSILGSSILAGIYFSAGKKLIQHYGAARFTTWTFTLGTIPLLIFAPQLIQQALLASPQTIGAAVYIGMFPAAVAYTIWFFAVDNIGSAKTSLYMYLVPITAIASTWIFLKTLPSFTTVLGGIIIICGLLLTRKKIMGSFKLPYDEEFCYTHFMNSQSSNEIIFHGHTFYTDERVYEPTVETETLLQNVIEYLEKNPCPSDSYILDVGTGSGALALSLGITFPELKVMGTDISNDALQVAEINKQKLHVSNVSFLHSDMLESIHEEPFCIIADLPWGSPDQLLGSNTKKDLAQEPAISLFPATGGPMDSYKELVKQIREKVWKTKLFIETGIMNEEFVKKELQNDVDVQYISYEKYSVTVITF